MPTGPEPLTPLPQRIAEVRPLVRGIRELALFDLTMERVNPAVHAAMQERYREAILVNTDRSREYKYLDVAFCVWRKVAKIGWLDLVRPRLRMLDIGSGGGDLSAVCSGLGHEVLGMDRPDPPLFRELHDLYGVKRVDHIVYPKSPFPDEVGEYDLITCLGVVFDIFSKTEDAVTTWTTEDWLHFLRALSARHVRFPGRIYVELNRRVEPDGSSAYDDLLRACQSMGARVDAARGRIMFSLTRPLALAEEAAH